MDIKKYQKYNVIPLWLRVFIFAVCYYFAYQLGVYLSVSPGFVCTIWIAAGVYLSALILSPSKYWIFYILATITINIFTNMHGYNENTILAISLSHTAEITLAVLAAWLINIFIDEPLNFSKLQHVLKFVLIILIAASIAALIGAYCKIVTYPALNYWTGWQIWSFADFMGMLIITPIIISFTHYTNFVPKLSTQKLVEIIVLMFLIILLSNFIFHDHADNHHWSIAFPYTLFPLLLWVTLRFNTFTATLISLCVALIALTNVHLGEGPLAFSNYSINDHIVSLQIFIAILSFSTLVLSAMISERKTVVQQLVDSKERYRSFIRNSTEGIWRMEINPGIDINLSPKKQLAIIKKRGVFEESNKILTSILGLEHNKTFALIDFELETIFPCENKRNQILLFKFMNFGYRTNNEIAYCTNTRGENLILLTNMVGTVENGLLVRIWGTETDITAQKKAEEEIKLKDQLNILITNLSTRFINLKGDEIDNAIIDSLKQITTFVGDQHSNILLFSDDKTHVEKVYEWCADGVLPQRSFLENISTENYPWLIKQFKNLNVIQTSSLSDLPPEAVEAKKMYQSLGIKSTIDVPLTLRGKFVGTLGFDSLSNERSWNDDSIALLRIIGEMFVSAIDKKKTETAFLQSEEKFYKAFHASPDVIAITSLDHEGRIIAINKGAAQKFGYTSQDVIGKDTLDFDIWVNHEARKQLLDRVNKKGRVTNHIADLRIRNGDILTFSISCVAIEIQGENCMMIIARDISKQKQLEKMARDQELQLIQADKMSSLGLMVSGMAHEVNNPNNLIQINSTLLSEMWPDIRRVLDDYVELSNQNDLKLAGLPYEEMRDTVPELVTSIHNGSKRIQAIVENLKNFSRRGDKQEFAKVDLNEIITAAYDLIRPQIMKKTDFLKMEIDQGLPLIKGHSQQLEQVLVNLITNALDALTSKDQSITIKTNTNIKENQIELRVIDQGSGISNDDLPYIFDPFFTTKLDDGGTGLGLAVSYNLIKAHGGLLSVKSIPNHGTEFLITLPIN